MIYLSVWRRWRPPTLLCTSQGLVIADKSQPVIIMALEVRDRQSGGRGDDTLLLQRLLTNIYFKKKTGQSFFNSCSILYSNRLHTWRFPFWWDCWRCSRWPPSHLSLALWRSQCFGTWFSFCTRRNRSDQKWNTHQHTKVYSQCLHFPEAH